MLKILNLSMKFRSFRISFEIFCRFAIATLQHCWGNLGVKELTDSPGPAASGGYRSVACEEHSYSDENCPVVGIIPEISWNEISRETGTQDVGSELSWCRQLPLSLIHISEPTRQEAISYAVFCLKKKYRHIRLTQYA